LLSLVLLQPAIQWLSGVAACCTALSIVLVAVK
jgi:hypothetical protein